MSNDHGSLINIYNLSEWLSVVCRQAEGIINDHERSWSGTGCCNLYNQNEPFSDYLLFRNVKWVVGKVLERGLCRNAVLKWVWG